MKDQAPSLSPTGLRPAPPGLPPHPSHSFRYLLSVKHTRDLLQLSPYHTQRALTEIEHSDMLNRFYAAAEDLGLYRERYRSLVTIEELDSVIRRVRSALQVIVWDAKRLSMTCRWLLRSVRKLQRFTRAHLSRLRDLKSKVAVMLTTAVQAAWQSLNVETREHTRRYRMPQQQVFVAEAYELLVDCHLDSDTVRNVVDSVWLHRKQMYHRRFSELQRGQKQDELKRLEDIQTLVRGVDPTDLENNAAVEFAAQAIASAGHSIMGRKDSMLTMRTLTFRRLRLLRVDFETPLLQFGPEHVTLAELCAHLRIMKARTVQQSIDKYFANQQQEDGDVTTADATSDEQANKSMPVVQRLSPAEALLVEQMLETSKQTRGPVSYFHALISLDCRTDWFTLYCLRRLNRGIVDVIPSVGAPEAMVAQYHVAEKIARSWGKLPGTAAATSHTTSSGGTSSKALKEKHSRPSSAPHQRPSDNGADRRYSLASDGQPKARCGFVALAGESVRRAERTSPDGSSRRHGLSPRGASSTRVSPTKSPPPHRAPQDRISPTALEPSGAETEVHKRQHQGTMSATTSPRSTRPFSFSSARDRYGTTYTSTSSASAQELWLDVLASHRDAIAKVKNQISARYISRENVVTTAALRQEHAADVATLERRIKYQGQQRKANHKPSDIKLWMQSWMSLPPNQHVTKENTTMPQLHHTSIPTSTSIGVEPNTPLEGLLASRRVIGSFKEPSATAAAGLPSRPTSAGVTRGQRPIPSTGGLLPPKGAAISLVIAPSSFRPKRTQ